MYSFLIYGVNNCHHEDLRSTTAGIHGLLGPGTAGRDSAVHDSAVRD